MKAKYETKNEVIQYSEPIEVKTQAKPSVPNVPSVPSVPSVPRQLTARELLEASYNEIRRAKREAHIEKPIALNQKCFKEKTILNNI